MNAQPPAPVRFSIGILAWNEELIIRQTLLSLFEQSFFEELSRRGERAEIICIPNGCTDDTAGAARSVFIEQKRKNPFAKNFSCRVESLAEAGKTNAWNAYVHHLSSRDAKFLCLMDSDILFNERETLSSLFSTLEKNPQAQISASRAVKDISLKKRKSFFERISLATSNMTSADGGQFTAQLYCLRAEIARRIWRPKDLGATDEGFIKAIICTDFFTSELNPRRILTAENASHIFEAYTSPLEILKNQKRQMIGQTTVHLLVDKYLKFLPLEQRTNLAATLRQNDERDPDWMKKLIAGHLRGKWFWQLFPGALTFRFKRWRKLKGFQRVTHFPAAFVGFLVTLLACFRAHRHFKRGEMHYWPKAAREKIRDIRIISDAPVTPPVTKPAEN